MATFVSICLAPLDEARAVVRQHGVGIPFGHRSASAPTNCENELPRQPARTQCRAEPNKRANVRFIFRVASSPSRWFQADVQC